MSAVTDEDVSSLENRVEVDVVLDDNVLLGESSSRLFGVLVPRPDDEQRAGRNEALKRGDDQLARLVVVDRPLRYQHHTTLVADAGQLRRRRGRSGAIRPQQADEAHSWRLPAARVLKSGHAILKEHVVVAVELVEYRTCDRREPLLRH